jgi:DNA-directed RNA polymerase alpha subunit
MQRLYIFMLIAAIVLAVSYRDQLKTLLPSQEKAQEESTESGSLDADDAYDELGLELYRTASKLSDLQGKIKVLEMAKEHREWFEEEEAYYLDDLIKATENELKETETAYQKAREEYAKRTAQKMLRDFSEKQ